MENPCLTKLDALRILANAYWYVAATYGHRDGILYDKFGYVRRSMGMEDLQPTLYRQQHKEGLNGPMPRFF